MSQVINPRAAGSQAGPHAPASAPTPTPGRAFRPSCPVGPRPSRPGLPRPARPGFRGLTGPGLRRLALGAAVSLAALGSLSAVPSVAYAGVGPGMLIPPPVRDEDRAGDRLVVTVRDAGGSADGTYELYCRPRGGSHPDPARACGAVEKNTRWGHDAFAPVPEGAACTMQDGGPATAHVTGTWSGRPVDATYDRSNGCQMERWDRLVPLLPDMR